MGLTQTRIAPDDPKIQYLGRIDRTNPLSPSLGWEGCEIRVSFTGTSLKMIMSSSGEHYYNIMLDREPSSITKLRISPANDVSYTLVSGLDNTTHTVSIFKRTPSLQLQYLKGFLLDAGDSLVTPPALSARKIEFYGDSQISGDAIECPTLTDTYEATYFNNYLAYGSVAARLLNAQYSCIAQGGARLSDIAGCFDKTKFFSGSSWDFSQWQADVVVINLGENDYPWTTDWDSTYVRFVQKIRQKYPNAYIWLCLGPMFAAKNTDFINGIAKVMTILADERVFTYLIKYSSAPHHPRVADASAVAIELVAEIKKVIWENEILLPAPLGLTSYAVSDTSFTLSWQDTSAVAEARTYEIYKNGIYLATSSDTSYSITGLIASTVYEFAIKSRDSSGNASGLSDTLQVNTLPSGITPSYLNSLAVYPNPIVDHTLFVDMENKGVGKEATIQIFNMNGGMEYQAAIMVSEKVVIELPGCLQMGMYILSIQADEVSFINKIMLE